LNERRGTIGILYPGELGSTLGRLLSAQGWEVVTTLDGRSARTQRLCAEAQLCVVSSLDEVARRAELVLLTTSPAAAVEVAARYGRVEGLRPGAVCVDLNSVSAATATEIGVLMARAGIEFVDGALHGLAARLPGSGVVYLSGPSAQRLADRLAGALPTRVLGDTPGQASAFKMLVSGLPKGVVAVFVEMCLAARQAGMLTELLARYREAYPGIMELAERMLPTYPLHSGRRADELGEVARTLVELGVEPRMALAGRNLTQAIADAHLPAEDSTLPKNGCLVDVLEALHARNPSLSAARSH
jgi:3-hydroxyisobutyrate dehydrogenase-like beta-hydroxyacid dehydrogenase